MKKLNLSPKESHQIIWSSFQAKSQQLTADLMLWFEELILDQGHMFLLD